MWYNDWSMSLRQEGEQTGERDSEFRNEQERLLDSAGEHLKKGCVAGVITGLATMVSPGAAVIVLEMARQFGAAAVDLGKHESNKRKHYISP